MEHMVDERTLARRDATAHARVLGDAELLYFMKYVRRRLGVAAAEDVPAYISALAALELETARRGIRLRGVREPLAPHAWRRRLEAAIAAADVESVEEMLPYLDDRGHWRAYRFATGLGDPADQARLLEKIRWYVDVRVHGRAAAEERHKKVLRALRKADDHRKAERLRGLLAYTFKHHLGLPDGESG